MDMSLILNQFKQSFNEIPEDDARAKIGPRLFVMTLIFSLSIKDRGQRTLAALRRSVISFTGEQISRGTFWERLATNRLLDFLLLLVAESMRQVGAVAMGPKEITSLLENLKVKGILVLDSTSITLPKNAGAAFPGPRRNVTPSVIKWHSCFDLVEGTMKWFDLSPGTSHDSNHFPDLKTLAGYLIIFDLGYFDFCLLQAIDNVGSYFLTRIKVNTIVQVEKVIQGLPKSFNGKLLFSKRIPKGREIIEVAGLFKDGLFQFRLIGFWNPANKCYHWYVTNLSVPAKLIYPLYRLRWQCELLFKAAKSSLNLSDISSSDVNIIQSLVLGSIAVMALTQPLVLNMSLLYQKDMKLFQVPSIQRTAIVINKMSDDFQNFLTSKKKNTQKWLVDKLLLFGGELFDPNQKRESSIKRVMQLTGVAM